MNGIATAFKVYTTHFFINFKAYYFPMKTRQQKTFSIAVNQCLNFYECLEIDFFVIFSYRQKKGKQNTGLDVKSTGGKSLATPVTDHPVLLR